MNLKKETIEILAICNRTPDDIDWVGSFDYELPLDDFWRLADTEYNSGYGAQEVARDLVIVLKDGSYMARMEYDGSEWWQFHETPRRPGKIIENAQALTVMQSTEDYIVGWCTLDELNGGA